MQISAREARNRLGEVKAAAERETVIITRYGRPYAALMSAARFRELQAAEAFVKETECGESITDTAESH